MIRIGSISVFVLAVISLSDAARAQNVTVQQPAFGRFSVGTTVSVPDRGSAFLGRVARAAESRKRFGFVPFGSSIGFSREHSGVSTRVWIHDLRAMDDFLLRQRRRASGSQTGPPLPGNAEHAYRSLMNRPVRNRVTNTPSTSRTGQPRTVSPPSVSTDEDPAVKFYRLGQRAEQRGRHSLARLHFRMAAKHGSKAAAAKLRR